MRGRHERIRMKVLIDIPSEEYKELAQTGENTINLGALLDLRNALSAGTPYAEQKKGRWLPDASGYGFWVCSCCKFPSEASGANVLYKFCPNCGTPMEGDEHGN